MVVVGLKHCECVRAEQGDHGFVRVPAWIHAARLQFGREQRTHLTDECPACEPVFALVGEQQAKGSRDRRAGEAIARGE